MSGRSGLLALSLTAVLSGCVFSNGERLTKLEVAVENLQAQEIRLAVLEDAVNTMLSDKQGAPQAQSAFLSGKQRVVPPVRTAEPELRTTVKNAPATQVETASRSTAQTLPATQGKTIAAVSSSTPASAQLSSPQASREYQVALSTLESGKPQAAMTLFSNFLREHPAHALAPNAGYWLGECHYTLKQYDSAVLAFKDVVALYPAHDKAAAALLKAGYSYAQLGDSANARFYFEALVKDFPASSPASLARTRLAAL